MDLRFSLFLTASVLAHAGLVAWKHDPRQALHIGGQAQALQVSLATLQSTPPAAEKRQPQPAAASRQRPLETTTSRPSPVRRTTVRPHPAERHPAEKTAPARAEKKKTTRVVVSSTTSPPPQSSSLQLSDRISAALRDQLAKRFEYPWLARKRGWQGRVTLSLRVENDGALTNWKILETSGHRLLDRSALKSAKAIGRLPQASEWLGGQSLELRIPVRFRLLGS